MIGSLPSPQHTVLVMRISLGSDLHAVTWPLHFVLPEPMPHAPEACKTVVDVLLAGLVCMRTTHSIHSATGPLGGGKSLLAVATEFISVGSERSCQHIYLPAACRKRP